MVNLERITKISELRLIKFRLSQLVQVQPQNDNLERARALCAAAKTKLSELDLLANPFSLFSAKRIRKLNQSNWKNHLVKILTDLKFRLNGISKVIETDIGATIRNHLSRLRDSLLRQNVLPSEYIIYPKEELAKLKLCSDVRPRSLRDIARNDFGFRIATNSESMLLTGNSTPRAKRIRSYFSNLKNQLEQSGIKTTEYTIFVAELARQFVGEGEDLPNVIKTLGKIAKKLGFKTAALQEATIKGRETPHTKKIRDYFRTSSVSKVYPRRLARQLGLDPNIFSHCVSSIAREFNLPVASREESFRMFYILEYPHRRERYSFDKFKKSQGYRNPKAQTPDIDLLKQYREKGLDLISIVLEDLKTTDPEAYKIITLKFDSSRKRSNLEISGLLQMDEGAVEDIVFESLDWMKDKLYEMGVEEI